MRDEFFHWQGQSGYWWIHTIISLDSAVLWRIAANYCLVRRSIFGFRVPLYWGQTNCIGRRFGEHGSSGLLEQALGLGANEVHVHLLQDDHWRRVRVETDLRNGHWTPLNQQPQSSAPTLFSSAY